MSVRTVHFATNRSHDTARLRFGVKPEDPVDRLWAGFAACIPAPSPMVDGKLGGFDVARPEDPEAGLAATIADWLSAAAAGEIPLLFVHGFNFRFEDALVRAADLAAWLEGGPGGVRFRPLVFTWPSNGLGTPAAYWDDRADAEGAAMALARLLGAIAAAKPKGAARPVLLCHSMGVFATRCGVQALADGVPRRVFRHAFVMAGDDETDVFDRPGGTPSAGGLRPLAAMADAVTVGFNCDDGVVWLVSHKIMHGKARLGAAGPHPRAALPANVAAVDYSMVAAKPPPWVEQVVPNGESEMNWIAHQYYRNNAAVRADMLAALAAGTGAVPGRRTGRRKPAEGVKEDPLCWYPAV